MRRTISAAIGGVTGALLLWSVVAPAHDAAAAPATSHAAERGDQFVLSGAVVVRPGSVVGDVVVVRGSATIRGRALGNVIVVVGPVVVEGLVRGDVVALNGRVTVASTGHVVGDVWAARDRLDVQVGARIDGRTREGTLSFLSPSNIVTKLWVWVAISLSTLLLGVLLLWLAPRAADAVFRAAQTAMGVSIGWGFGLFVGLPVAAFILVVSLVGIPFGVGLLLALALLYSLGYTWSAWALGRALIRPSRHGGPRRFTAFLAGWLLLRAVAFVPVLGAITWALGAVLGLGLMAVSVWRARRPPSERAAALPPPFVESVEALPAAPGPSSGPPPTAPGL
jgi:cytoskeletal protein CcmA (bactofilin family)